MHECVSKWISKEKLLETSWIGWSVRFPIASRYLPYSIYVHSTDQVFTWHYSCFIAWSIIRVTTLFTVSCKHKNLIYTCIFWIEFFTSDYHLSGKWPLSMSCQQILWFIENPCGKDRIEPTDKKHERMHAFTIILFLPIMYTRNTSGEETFSFPSSILKNSHKHYLAMTAFFFLGLALYAREFYPRWQSLGGGGGSFRVVFLKINPS